MSAPTEPIVFFGTADFSAVSLRRLIADGYNIATVVTKPDAPVGRKRVVTAPAVKQVASEHDIPALQPAKAIEALDELRSIGARWGVVVSYGGLLPQEILDLFEGGLINTHASLLPRWRGASPIEHAILHGDHATGVTLMKIDAGLDTGDIYCADEIELSGSETAPQLYELLGRIAADALSRELPRIFSGALPAKPQPSKGATTCGFIKKDDGVIDWSSPAVVIERQIRAYLGWPGSRTQLFGKDVTITAAEATTEGGEEPGTSSGHEHGLVVATGQGGLIIKRLKPAGGREMDAADFMRGHNKPEQL